MKILVNNKTIDLGEEVKGLVGDIQTMGNQHSEVAKRDTLKIDFPFGRKEYDAIGWEDYMPWVLLYEIPVEEGEPTVMEYDKSDYYLICDIVEHQDTGNITVYMGKPTNEELLEDTINDLMEV